MRQRLQRNIGAFTLAELLVVIAIILVLLGLAVPAIQKCREVNNRAICTHNLHQIGLALHQFHGDYNCFPSNGGWDGKQTILDVSGKPFVPKTHDAGASFPFVWGVGDPARSPVNQTGSWAYAILPYVEETEMHLKRTWETPVKLYICPERRRPIAQEAVDKDQWGEYFGGGWKWGKTDYAGNALVIPNRPMVVHMAEIQDGTSNTFLVGEKAMRPDNYISGTWYWDEPFFLGGSQGTQRSGRFVLKDDMSMDRRFRFNWGSAHSGGANFLYADGSVRLIPHGTESSSVHAFMTPMGGEVNQEIR
jgi:prepilin-type processing-associated H-X9-DG protein